MEAALALAREEQILDSSTVDALQDDGEWQAVAPRRRRSSRSKTADPESHTHVTNGEHAEDGEQKVKDEAKDKTRADDKQVDNFSAQADKRKNKKKKSKQRKTKEGENQGAREPTTVTKPCYAFANGSCRRGARCRFSHAINGVANPLLTTQAHHQSADNLVEKEKENKQQVSLAIVCIVLGRRSLFGYFFAVPAGGIR